MILYLKQKTNGLDMINMNDEGYSFYFGPKTLFLEFHVPMKETSITDAINQVKESFPDTEITVVAYKNIIGYWSAYNIKNKQSIYCGSMSLKRTKDSISNYLNNIKDENISS